MKEKYEEALVCFEKYIELNANNGGTLGHKKLAGVYKNHGNSLFYLGRSVLSLQSYEKSIEIDPTDFKTYFGKSVALNDLEKYEEALIALEKTIQLEPRYEKAIFNKAKLLKTLKRFRESIDTLDDYLLLDGMYARAYLEKGKCLHAVDSFEEAILTFEKGINLKPKNALHELFYNQALAYYELKKKKESVELIRRAIKHCHDENFQATYYNSLAVALYDLDRIDDAYEANLKVIELNPFFSSAYNQIGNLNSSFFF